MRHWAAKGARLDGRTEAQRRRAVVPLFSSPPTLRPPLLLTSSFVDRVFDNEINIAVHRAKSAYERMLFREALKVGW